MQSQRRTDIRAPLLLSSIYLNFDVLPAKGPGKIAAILLGLLLFLLGLLLFLLGLLLLIILLELLHSLLGGLVILIQGDLKLHRVPVPVNGEGHLIARLTVLDGGFEGLAARHCGAVDSGDNIARLESGLAGAGAVQDSQHLRAGGNAVLLGLLGHVLH